MDIITKNEEFKILEILESIKNSNKGYYGLHFYFSKLEEKNKSNFQLRVASNIIKDFFKSKDGYIVNFSDNDIILIFENEERTLVEKIIFQLRYLFIDDSLAFEMEGVENHKFCSVYILSFQWRDLYVVCNRKLQLNVKNRIAVYEELNHSNLNLIVTKLGEIDIERAVQSQYIFGYNDNNENYKSICKEISINYANLQEQLGVEVNITIDTPLFKYLKKLVDEQFLNFLHLNENEYFTDSFSINLSMKSLFSKKFANVVKILQSKTQQVSVIIELQISDILENFKVYLDAKELLDSLNFKIAVNGLTERSVLQIERENLGVDFLKVKWSQDSMSFFNDLNIDKFRKIVQKSGANRIILYGCDESQALSIGKKVGLRLFQGKYIDKFMQNRIAQSLTKEANISTWELYTN